VDPVNVAKYSEGIIMLIENKKNEVITFKLINGDEILGRIVANDVDTVTISRPMKLIIGPNGPGLTSPLFTADLTKGDLLIKTDHVVFSAPTESQIASDYIQQITGITTATSSMITL